MVQKKYTMIRIVPHRALNLTEDEKNRLFQLMIHAYAITEEDIWGKHYKRLERDEFSELLETSTFFIALEDEKILGSIQVYQKDASTFGFGLLNVDFEHTGKNIPNFRGKKHPKIIPQPL